MPLRSCAAATDGAYRSIKYESIFERSFKFVGALQIRLRSNCDILLSNFDFSTGVFPAVRSTLSLQLFAFNDAASKSTFSSRGQNRKSRHVLMKPAASFAFTSDTKPASSSAGRREASNSG